MIIRISRKIYSSFFFQVTMDYLKLEFLVELIINSSRELNCLLVVSNFGLIKLEIKYRIAFSNNNGITFQKS